jgi:hypothetical protein
MSDKVCSRASVRSTGIAIASVPTIVQANLARTGCDPRFRPTGMKRIVDTLSNAATSSAACALAEEYGRVAAVE